MIRVTLMKSFSDMESRYEFYVDTDCFSTANDVVTKKAQERGIDMDEYPITAMSVIAVIRV